MTHIRIQPIGKRISQWGEGPIWWNGQLVYVDIEDHRVISLDPSTGEETTWDTGERVGTVVPRLKGGLIYAGDNGITLLDPETSHKTGLADPEADKRPDNRFNDGKCDPAGRLWAGTISTVKKTGDAKLYMLDTDRSLSVKIDAVTNSNGICWTADAKTMYYIDTPTKQIQAYDYAIKTGAIAGRRVVVDTAASGFDSSPDGMTIDAEDKIWVAFCHGGCVARFDPEDGRLLLKVELPCLETTACAFGGEKLDRLFVTTGIHKTVKEEHAGKIFVIDNLGVRGVPALPYKG